MNSNTMKYISGLFKIAILSTILLVLPLGLNAQFNGGSLQSEHFYTELPFEYVHDKIVIEASMNGIKGRYLLDTGAMCILFKDSTELKFADSYQMKIGDATGKKQMAEVVQMPLIEVGELKYQNIPILYVDMFEGPFKCLGYKGIIGSNLLRFGAFKIDWGAQKLIIAESYQALGIDAKKGSKMHVNKQQSSPFVKTKVNGKNIRQVLIDTGSGDIFSLYNATAKWLMKKGRLGQASYISSGTNSHGAWGAGEHQTSIFQQVELALGNTELTDVSVETSDGKSKIGMKILEKGDFILDYPQKRFFFDVKEHHHAFLIESFGIDLVMRGEQFVVNGIWKGTLAEASGIEEGDVVVGIEGMQFKDISICQVFLTLKEQTQAREQLTFYLRKPGESERRKVTLPRLKI